MRLLSTLKVVDDSVMMIMKRDISDSVWDIRTAEAERYGSVRVLPDIEKGLRKQVAARFILRIELCGGQ